MGVFLPSSNTKERGSFRNKATFGQQLPIQAEGFGRFPGQVQTPFFKVGVVQSGQLLQGPHRVHGQVHRTGVYIKRRLGKVFLGRGGGREEHQASPKECDRQGFPVAVQRMQVCRLAEQVLPRPVIQFGHAGNRKYFSQGDNSAGEIIVFFEFGAQAKGARGPDHAAGPSNRTDQSGRSADFELVLLCEAQKCDLFQHQSEESLAQV